MAISVKIVVGAAMAVVVLIVASVTLAITYTVSIDAVRTSGQRLAGSMTDTVGTRVSNYMNTSERAVTDIVQSAQYPGFMLTIDDPEVKWWQKWLVLLRTIMIESDWDYSNVAFTPDDGGLIVLGTWWVNTSYVYSYALDPRSLASTGLSTLVTLENRAKYTFAPYTGTQGSFYPDYFKDQRGASFYYLKQVTQYIGAPLCVWASPSVNTFSIPTGDFVIYNLCTLFNGSGVFMGQAAAGRRFVGIGQFLNGNVVTPHTTMFVIDNGQQLVASTYPAPAWQFYNPNDTEASGKGCVSSGIVTGRTTRVGCRAFASQYPYAPLQSIASSDPNFINGTGRDERYGSLAGDTYYYVSLRMPSNFQSYKMNLVLFMPETDVLGGIKDGLNTAIGVTVAVFFVAVVVSFLLLQVLLSPLDEVTERMYRVANLETDDGDVSLDGETDEFMDLKSTQPRLEPLAKSGMTEIRALQVAYETMDSALQSFTRYVPRDVVRELVSNGQICEIAMRPAMCSMLFVDIANFTSMCERIPAPALSTLVRKYFERNSRVVMGHGGIIDKFIGDCVMAVWGAPIQIDKHELRSAVCARMLVHEAQSDPLKSAFAEMGEALAVRVGVATGEVLAGNMGSAERMSYTVIGDDVNLAARLESLNKQWGTNSLVSETTALECQDWLVMRHVATIAVVGKDQPVAVSEIIGVKPNIDTEIVGAVTSEASENNSMTQVQRDREKEAMDQKYLQTSAADSNAGAVSVGKLLRRAMRKAPVAPEDITWAAEYSAAVALYEKRDFAGCLGKLRSLRPPFADSASVRKLTVACEGYIQKPPEASFRGVWQADDK